MLGGDGRGWVERWGLWVEVGEGGRRKGLGGGWERLDEGVWRGGSGECWVERWRWETAGWGTEGAGWSGRMLGGGGGVDKGGWDLVEVGGAWWRLGDTG